MNTLHARFDIVTPMFLGGAAPQTPQGIRPASVKGALRFWWRALNWCHAAKAHPTDTHAALRHLHAEESRLFGRSAVEQGSKQVGGQGVFVMQVSDQSGRAEDQPFGTGFDNGILYLLGMGLGSFKNGNHCLRGALPAGKGFELRLLFRPGTKPADIASVVDAVKAFGLLGALGSRARHGMGSVALTSLTATSIDLHGWSAPATAGAYRDALTTLLKTARSATGEPPLSAFSTVSRIDLSMQCTGRDAATELLADLGRKQQAYRSYGRQNPRTGEHETNGVKAEQNFKADHDLALDAACGKTVNTTPQRVIFGLPHNYFFSTKIAGSNPKVDINYRPDGNEGRRASPLLLHIHRLGDGTAVAVHTLLSSCFLPEGRSVVTMKPGRGGALDNVPVTPDWQVLHRYLDRFKTNSASTWATL